MKTFILKLKDNIDFKELIKYGFRRIQYLSYYSKIIYYDDNKLYNYIEYIISTKDRKITINTTDIGNYKYKHYLDETLYLLIKDDLIQIVEDM